MAELRFSHGVMSAGKSTLALQVEHTWAEAGRSGLLLTSHDRGGAGVVTSRLGMRRPAAEVGPGTHLPRCRCRCCAGAAPPARMNARLVDGDVVREGEQVLLGDTRTDAGSALFGPEVRYEVLCRRHWVRCETRPAVRRGANA